MTLYSLYFWLMSAFGTPTSNADAVTNPAPPPVQVWTVPGPADQISNGI
ncbi:MAG: hypothetical protein GY913_06025 [Proteobacteria bacterium]|nr:hypothetical protein [Pseudomonadota bacterium]MCP4916463.1 hypothetical protein [Pseudomonadota bacterium]